MLLPDHARTNPAGTVAVTPNGSVSRCPECGLLKLRFGNALLCLDAADLTQLRAVVRSAPRRGREAAVTATSGDRRSIELYRDGSGVGFAFTPAEIEELGDLLSAAARWLAGHPNVRDAATVDDLALIAEVITHRPAGFRDVHS